MNPYEKFVADFMQVTESVRHAQLGGFAPCARPALKPDARKLLIFSPHPDDECIVGGLAIRLLCEQGVKVVNVAVTQGSNKARQAARFEELKGACQYLGFGLVQVQEGGLEKINPKGRAADPANWAAAVDRIAAILRAEQPFAVLIPHNRDWNTTHIGTHELVLAAFAKLGPAWSCRVIENEYWAPMDDPNVMVELSAATVTELITALSFHVGEVARNPYHIGLPSWMRDNVRRGGELVGGQGKAVPDFPFAVLYRVRHWAQGGLKPCLSSSQVLSCQDSLAVLLA